MGWRRVERVHVAESLVSMLQTCVARVLTGSDASLRAEAQTSQCRFAREPGLPLPCSAVFWPQTQCVMCVCRHVAGWGLGAHRRGRQ